MKHIKLFNESIQPKHLKPFNESKENLLEELQDFCETNLAYLIDEGTEVDITNTGPFNGIGLYEIRITSNYKEWSSIKDHMIPFLTRLQNKYNIIPYPAGHDILVRGKRQMDTNGYVTGKGKVRELIEDEVDFFVFHILDFILYIQQKN